MGGKRDLILNTAASRRLQELMASHPAFGREPKMKVEAVKFLVKLAEEPKNWGKDFGVSYKRFKSAFQGSKTSHATFKKALLELGLLDRTKQYVAPLKIPGVKLSPRASWGSVAHYRITEKFREYYLEAGREAVCEFDGRDSIRIKDFVKKRNRRLLKAKKISDAYSKHHEVLACTVDTDWGNFDADQKTVDEACAILVRIATADYPAVRNDGKKCRLHHPLASFPSELRKHLRVEDRVYCGEVDIRACWPTYLAAALLRLNKDADTALRTECDKWQKMFCAAHPHPRQVISDEMPLPMTSEAIKEALNKYLNGVLQTAEMNNWKVSPEYHALDDWFSSAYPSMHKAWRTAGPDKLGDVIGKSFETPLMADPELYDFAESNGITLYYQYDGFGVFAPLRKQEALEAVLAGLCQLMTKISNERFGVPIVVQQGLMIQLRPA
jgi:hypothetical protein